MKVKEMFKGLNLKFGAILTALFVLWLGLGAYINFFRYESMTGEAQTKDADMTAKVLAAGVSKYMADSDYAGLDKVTGALSGVKDIAFIRITDASGAVVRQEGSDKAQDLVVVTRDIAGGQAGLGRVAVGISSVDHKRAMRGYFIWQGTAVVLLGLVSLYVLIFSFKRLVLNPLDRMNGILKGMAEGGGDLTQRLDASARDEIGELAENFNTFLARLRDLVAVVQETASRVFLLTERIGDKSKGIISTAKEQVTGTNDNFKVLERMDRSVQDVAGGAESLSFTAQDSSATVTEMAAQVEVVADSTMELSGHVEEASSSISQMASSIKEVAGNVTVLADLASHTANAVSRIEISVKEVEAKAKLSAALSQKVSDDADTLGNEAIAKTIEGMERIRETVEVSSEVIERLGERSVEIGQIVKVIDEVTKQTSLLALNAAILASQAGEHGKGFEVVASEIKDLAERTSASTGLIAKLIKSVQKEAAAAVESMRSGKERVQEGTQLAYGAADALRKMIESSTRSQETAVAIENDTASQAESIRQASDAVKNVHERIQYIEKATREQSKGSELIAQAAEKINDIAKEVRRAMAEQAKGIKEFARSLDDTKEMVSTIAEATRNQSSESSGLVASMEKFLDIAQKNSDISTDMDIAVAELLNQAETLRNEMGRFRV